MTKDEILTRLAAAYTGPGSAEEGTFAGDVLRACADGMAQLWSMDIDGWSAVPLCPPLRGTG